MAGIIFPHHRLPRMSRRGNTVAESAFPLLKGQGIRWQTFATRNAARLGIFGCGGMAYNPKRTHTKTGILSRARRKQQRKMKSAGV